MILEPQQNEYDRLSAILSEGKLLHDCANFKEIKVEYVMIQKKNSRLLIGTPIETRNSFSKLSQDIFSGNFDPTYLNYIIDWSGSNVALTNCEFVGGTVEREYQNSFKCYALQAGTRNAVYKFDFTGASSGWGFVSYFILPEIKSDGFIGLGCYCYAENGSYAHYNYTACLGMKYNDAYSKYTIYLGDYNYSLYYVIENINLPVDIADGNIHEFMYLHTTSGNKTTFYLDKCFLIDDTSWKHDLFNQTTSFRVQTYHGERYTNGLVLKSAMLKNVNTLPTKYISGKNLA